MKTTIIVFSLLVLSSHAFAVDIGFREFKMGMFKSEALRISKEKYIHEVLDQMVVIDSEIKGVPVKVHLNFKYNKLWTIEANFFQKDFGKVYSALKDKYKKPTQEKTLTFQNTFGARFPYIIASWDFRDGKILVREFSDNLQVSNILFASKEAVKTIKIKELIESQLPGF